MTEANAALYEAPFEYTRANLYTVRRNNKREAYKERWWIHVEARPTMRTALEQLDRFIVTPTVAKHRLFVWMSSPTLPDHQLIAIARADDFFLGVLHSGIHEVWGLRLGTRLESRPRYTPTTCFETFPFPEPTAEQRDAIAAAAKQLDALRTNWLNPPEWMKAEVLEFPGSVTGPWKRYVHDPDPGGIGTVCYPRTLAKDEASAAKLKARTLTNLYNEMPTWLRNAHRQLDEAVFAAYGWPPTLSDEDILARLLDLNLGRSGDGPQPSQRGQGREGFTLAHRTRTGKQPGMAPS